MKRKQDIFYEKVCNKMFHPDPAEIVVAKLLV